MLLRDVYSSRALPIFAGNSWVRPRNCTANCFPSKSVGRSPPLMYDQPDDTPASCSACPWQAGAVPLQLPARRLNLPPTMMPFWSAVGNLLAVSISISNTAASVAECVLPDGARSLYFASLPDSCDCQKVDPWRLLARWSGFAAGGCLRLPVLRSCTFCCIIASFFFIIPQWVTLRSQWLFSGSALACMLVISTFVWCRLFQCTRFLRSMRENYDCPGLVPAYEYAFNHFFYILAFLLTRFFIYRPMFSDLPYYAGFEEPGGPARISYCPSPPRTQRSMLARPSPYWFYCCSWSKLSGIAALGGL